MTISLNLGILVGMILIIILSERNRRQSRKLIDEATRIADENAKASNTAIQTAKGWKKESEDWMSIAKEWKELAETTHNKNKFLLSEMDKLKDNYFKDLTFSDN